MLRSAWRGRRDAPTSRFKTFWRTTTRKSHNYSWRLAAHGHSCKIHVRNAPSTGLNAQKIFGRGYRRGSTITCRHAIVNASGNSNVACDMGPASIRSLASTIQRSAARCSRIPMLLWLIGAAAALLSPRVSPFCFSVGPSVCGRFGCSSTISPLLFYLIFRQNPADACIKCSKIARAARRFAKAKKRTFTAEKWRFCLEGITRGRQY